MKARIVWLLLAAIWGSTWMFIKIGLEDLPPISFAGIRFVLASLILWAIVAARRAPLPRVWRDWSLILKTGVLAFAVNYGLLFWGEQHISLGWRHSYRRRFPSTDWCWRTSICRASD